MASVHIDKTPVFEFMLSGESKMLCSTNCRGVLTSLHGKAPKELRKIIIKLGGVSPICLPGVHKEQ